ncbi:MAG: NosD domain-containing protein, partial [Anaerolineae bacterium]
MKSRYLFLSLTLGLGLALALLWLSAGGMAARAAPAPAPAGAELHVCLSGCVYGTIQAAVHDALPGDVIKGTYSDVQHIPALDTATFTATQLVAITESLTIRGGYTAVDWTTSDPDAHPTVLDAGGAGRVMVIVGYVAPTIEGLRLTGGNSAGLGGSVYDYDAGGGLYILNSTAVISHNQIYGNTGYRAGGVWLQDSAASLRANLVRDNTAGWAGAGLWLYRSPATVEANDIVSNTTLFGGGIVLHVSDATLVGNNVLSNTATSTEGGGISVLSSGATLEGNLIRGNRVDQSGGGVFLSLSDATLTNNVIADNFSNARGSGVSVRGGAPRLIHNTIARNLGLGGGLYAVTSTVGIVSDVALTNTIIYSHTEGIIAERNNTVTLHSTLWHNNLTDWIGQGTITHVADYQGDPAFATDGYHLTLASNAARDRGLPAGVATDVDGQPRPLGRGYDLGADE